MTVLETYRKILKNRKYYFKIHDEIRFEKFDVVFKLKTLESSGNTGRHQNRSNFDKFRKISKNVFSKNEILRNNVKAIFKNSISFENYKSGNQSVMPTDSDFGDFVK